MTGLIVALVVVVLGTGIGLWRRRTDGRFRPVRAGGSTSATAQPAAATARPAAATARPAAATARPAAATAQPDAVAEPDGDGGRLDGGLLAGLGVQPAQATLLQFSTAFCAPCRAVRRVSSEVAAMVQGVQHVEVDAESHLDAVRALAIWRTPTLLVLDADGRVAKRATGVPSKAQLIAVLGEIVPGRSAPDRR
jgi:thiol-disulfide isomerase/thioredoxin